MDAPTCPGRARQFGRALAGHEPFTPLRQGVFGTQNGLGRLDQQATQVLASVAANAATPLALATVVKGRIEADVFDQAAGTSKALDVADERTQGEGDPVADTAQAHDRQ